LRLDWQGRYEGTAGTKDTYDLSCTWDRQDEEVNRADMHFLHISPVAVEELGADKGVNLKRLLNIRFGDVGILENGFL
jgi:hypothetical protein